MTLYKYNEKSNKEKITYKYNFFKKNHCFI